MTQIPEPIRLSSAIRCKLLAVRRRYLWLGLAEAAALGATVLTLGMLLAMGVDFVLMLIDSHWRVALTMSVLLAATFAFARRLCQGWVGRFRLTSIARHVDQALPFLEERWSAASELSFSQDPPALRGSTRMAKQLMLEAESAAHLVSPEAIVPPAGLRRRLRHLAGAVAILCAALFISPEQTSILLRRFWQPTRHITLTRIQAMTATRVVPRGEPLTLSARIEGRLRPTADLVIVPDRAESADTRDSRGRVFKQSRTLTPAAGEPQLFEFSLLHVREPFAYRFRAGDDQTAWHRIIPEDRPGLERVQFRITPPEYSGLAAEERDKLPRSCRVLEGSRLQIRFVPDKPLAGLQLRHANERVEALEATPSGIYDYDVTVAGDMAFTPVLVDQHGLTNRAIPPCRIVAYQDKPPTVELVWPKDDLVVNGHETVSIEFIAQDDLGVAEAELLVTIDGAATQAAPASQPAESSPGLQDHAAASAPMTTPALGPAAAHRQRQFTMPVPLGKQKNAKRVDGRADLDLKLLGLKHGEQVSCAIRVSDARVQSSTTAQASAGNPCKAGGAAGDQAPTSRPAGDEAGQDQEQSTPPPENLMAKRLLDVPGQCCSSACRIRVDEWAGSYAGEPRDKKQISIQDHLERLDRALAEAEDVTRLLLPPSASTSPWTAVQAGQLAQARRHLDEAGNVIVSLEQESSGTPYAFISLQLEDIGLLHVRPARQRLIDAEVVARSERRSSVEQAAFHIRRGREMLADLTREYEVAAAAANRDRAIERLARMHQLFVEDMQALLGACKPTLNPRTGRWRIVPDDLAEEVLKRIQACLDRKKALQEALAGILAEDPDLLRRYMAMTRKEASTLRDQLTLLAGRQEHQRDAFQTWVEAGSHTREQVLSQYWSNLVLEQIELALVASGLAESMETWAPRQAQRETGPLSDCIATSNTLARLSRSVPRLLSTDKVESALQIIAEEIVPLSATLQEQLAAVERDDRTPAMLRFVVRRMDDIMTLLDRQEDWLARARVIRAGGFYDAAAIDQQRLIEDTSRFAQKLVGTASHLKSSLSAEIGALAGDLVQILVESLDDHQRDALDAIRRELPAAARAAQDQSVRDFAEAGRRFDALLGKVEEFLAQEPFAPTSAPADDKPFEQLLAELVKGLEEEADACEKLGAVVRSNIKLEGDWTGKGSGGGGGSGNAGQGNSGGAAGARGGQAERLEAGQGHAGSERELAPLQSAFARARACQADAAQALDQVHDAREAQPEMKTDSAAPAGPSDATAETLAPLQDWDQLASKLGNALRQGRDMTPPEQYRVAIEAYFRHVAGGVTSGRSAATDNVD